MLKEFPKEIQELIDKYKEKYNKMPDGWCFDEETLNEYKKRLEREFNK